MKSILIPTDFSEESENAIKLGVEMAQKFGFKIILLNVVEGVGEHTFVSTGEVSSNDHSDDLYVYKLIGVNEKKLETIFKEEIEKGIDITWKLKKGRPFDVICEMSTTESIDMIVMGSKGVHGTLNELFIGSNAERVIRKAECPVMVVKQEVSLERLKSIVFATDFNNQDDALMNHVSGLSKVLGATIHLLKINHGACVTDNRSFKQESDEFSKRNKLQNFTCNLYTDYSVEKGIIHFAEDSGANIIALGVHERSTISHIIMGSVAEDIVNHAKRPVISLKLNAQD